MRYCATESRLAAEGLVGHAQGEWLDRVRDDLENYRSVLIWLIERGRSVEASTIVYRLFFFWVIRGHASEGLEWYERILAVPSPPPSVEATALIGAAVMRYTQAEFEKSRTAATRRARTCLECRRPRLDRGRGTAARASRTCQRKRTGGARPLRSQPRGVPAVHESLAHRKCADRHGARRNGDGRIRRGGPAASRGCRDASRQRTVLLVASSVPPSHPGGQAWQRRRGDGARAGSLGPIRELHDSSPSSTRLFRSPPPQHSRARTSGGTDSAPVTPSQKQPAHDCDRSVNELREETEQRFAHVSATTDGLVLTQQVGRARYRR